MGKVTPTLKKSGTHIELGVEQGQLSRVGQHVDLEDSGPSNLQGDNPSKSAPIKGKEEWFAFASVPRPGLNPRNSGGS